MTKYQTGVLTVIAAGVLLVAYGLLGPRASAGAYPSQNPYGLQAGYAPGAPASFGADTTVPCANGLPVTYPYGNPYVGSGSVMPAVAQPVRAVAAVESAPVARRQTGARRVVRAPRRDWKKTALLVGGSTAAAAGIGGLIGGKKGALVGAALGGGASTLYETTR